MKRKKIALIGSGFGGLAEAIRLQARGFDVTIFEKRAKVGGRANQFIRNGYTFDTGPSLITAPEIIERVFTAAGRTMQSYVDLIPLDPFYRIYFHDGASLDYTGDRERMMAEMAKFSSHDARQYDRLMERIRPIYDAVITEGLGSSPFLTWRHFLRFVPRALTLGGLSPVYSFASRYLEDERNRFAFSFHPLFIGGSPFRAPSIYIMIPYLEKIGGVWFSRGGMYSLVRAFERLFREIGGSIRTDAEVREILVNDGKAVGVRVGTEDIPSDAVVSNGDVPWVYRNLITPAHRRKWTDRRLDRLHIAMSCFLLYIGVRKQYPNLKHHTLILSRRYRELVRDIFDRKILADDFSLYLHVPSRTDPDMAPPGCESMYILSPVPHLGSGVEWNRKAEEYRDRIH